MIANDETREISHNNLPQNLLTRLFVDLYEVKYEGNSDGKKIFLFNCFLLRNFVFDHKTFGNNMRRKTIYQCFL